MKSPLPPPTSTSNTARNQGLYSSAVIEGFRQFKHLELNNFARVNLFFGPNNSGKTSILEALYTHACGFNFASILALVVLNRPDRIISGALDIGERLLSLFQNTSSLPYKFTISAKLTEDSSTHTATSTFHPSPEISDLDPRILGSLSVNLPSDNQAVNTFLSAEISYYDSVLQSLNISQKGSGIFIGKWQTNINDSQLAIDLYVPLSNPNITIPFKQAVLHDILAHRELGAGVKIFSFLKRYGLLHKFTEEMKFVFPDIREIDIIPYPDGTLSPVTIATTDSRRLPLYAFGDGMRRWFYLLGQMLVFQNAVHCIEEIDATFHPAAQSDFTHLLVNYAEKFNNQLFLTSHSLEFADALFDSLYGENGVVADRNEDPVRVFTTKRSPDPQIIEVWSFTGREAYESRHLYELELRG